MRKSVIMDKAFRRFCVPCRGGKPQSILRQFPYFFAELAISVKSTSDELVVCPVLREEIGTGGISRFHAAYDAGGPQSTRTQSCGLNRPLLQPLLRAQSGSAPRRNFASNAGNSAQPPSKVQQYLEFVKLKATARLENIPKKAYLRSLENVLKTAPELEGSVENVMRQIEENYEEVLKRHGDLAKDSRGASHLQMASLALASYRTLLPHFAHNRAVTADLIKEPIGAAAADTLNFMSRFVLFLSFDKFAHVSRGLEYLGRDFGKSFETEEHKELGFHSLKVTRCLYNTFFERQGVPDLTRLFCAFDRMWFDHVSPARHGIEFSRPTTLADGAPCCDFVLRRKDRQSSG